MTWGGWGDGPFEPGTIVQRRFCACCGGGELGGVSTVVRRLSADDFSLVSACMNCGAEASKQEPWFKLSERVEVGYAVVCPASRLRRLIPPDLDLYRVTQVAMADGSTIEFVE